MFRSRWQYQRISLEGQNRSLQRSLPSTPKGSSLPCVLQDCFGGSYNYPQWRVQTESNQTFLPLTPLFLRWFNLPVWFSPQAPFQGFLAYPSPILIKNGFSSLDSRSFPCPQGPCVLSEGLLDPLNCHPHSKRVHPVEALAVAVTSHTPPRILIWATQSPFIPLNQADEHSLGSSPQSKEKCPRPEFLFLPLPLSTPWGPFSFSLLPLP